MNNSINTQVCIIGGGPGGTCSSAYLNKYKIPHVLIEADTFPRTKPCADTISIHELNRIKEILPNAYNELIKHSKLHAMNGINFYSPLNKAYKYTFPSLSHFNGNASSYTIKRELFDHILFSEVKNLEYSDIYDGVRAIEIIHTKDGVTVKTSKGIINCQMVIVASGCKSLFAQKYTHNSVENHHYSLGLRGYFRNVKVDNEDYSEFYLDKKIFFGALYICALGNNLYNVNIVMKHGSLLGKKESFRKIFSDILEQHPVLAEKFKNATLEGKIEGHGLLLGSKKRTLSLNRTLFVGDAAGLIDIISANGIPQAMKSAKIAVDTIVKARIKNDFSGNFLKQYDKNVYTLLKKELRIGKFVLSITRNKFLSNLIITTLPYLINKKLIYLFLNLSLYTKNPFSKLMKSTRVK